jgi:hypothetical protein
MKAKVLNQIFYGICFFLIGSSVVFAFDHGIKGEYRDMHNSLNWVLWISITMILMYIIKGERLPCRRRTTTSSL